MAEEAMDVPREAGWHGLEAWSKLLALALALTGAGLTGVSTYNTCVIVPLAARLEKLEDAHVLEVRDRTELVQRMRVVERETEQNGVTLRKIEARLR